MDVLGSMCCFLSTDHIQNSDPYLLEKLKQCPDLSAQQISGVESVLLRGNTVYGYKLTRSHTHKSMHEHRLMWCSSQIFKQLEQNHSGEPGDPSAVRHRQHMEQIQTGTRASGETRGCLWISLITLCVCVCVRKPSRGFSRRLSVTWGIPTRLQRWRSSTWWTRSTKSHESESRDPLVRNPTKTLLHYSPSKNNRT